MFNDKISDYVEGVAAKYLSTVDAESKSSNQHEIGGLIKAGFGEFLGTGREDFHYRVRQVYVGDETEDPVICDGHVTWYDTRRDKLDRGPEYRLYYYDSPVTELMNGGDFFLIAKLRNELLPISGSWKDEGVHFRDGSFLMVFAPAGSTAEHQLRAMFGLGQVGPSLKAGKVDAVELLLPLRSMLENLGVEVGSGLPREDDWLGKLIDRFGGKTFPKTSDFSAFAREHVEIDVSPVESPDAALMAWMEREESFFRVYERYLVRERLAAGFGENGEDVDAFIDFSLSVQNRRKSRVGHAFEGHLNHLFKENGLKFQQGRGKDKVTENNSKPDFLFPSFAAYHNKDYPTTKLVMLGAKTTCKDRWRQVLSEADRITSKHLVTLEPAITEAQTDEMHSHRLQLVIPTSIHSTYSKKQHSQLVDVGAFIQFVRALQS